MHSAGTYVRENHRSTFPSALTTFGLMMQAKHGVLALSVLSALLLVIPARTHAQSETVLYSFCAKSGCTDGSSPYAGLVLDTKGNLYGTTYRGGANGKGTVFEVNGPGSETVLYSFCSQSGCKDGYHPEAGLILANGNLYGTAYDGGAHEAGVVFEITGGGAETVIYSFCVKRHCADGYYPHSDLVRDNNGNLFGTTQFNGAYGGGTVYEVSASGTETVVYSFCAQPNCADGSGPRAGLVLDANGNLYGTTFGGGANGKGTVFKVTPNGTETVLHSFCSQAGCKDGSNPLADLVIDTNGNLYGTTVNGGANGKGTIFEVSANGGETVLYDFCSQRACRDGSMPKAGLIMDTQGNLYGTTFFGGAQQGRGTVFELSASGAETVLHSFRANGTDGYNPVAKLVMDGKGNLYGTTLAGGANKGGTVFEVTP